MPYTQRNDHLFLKFIAILSPFLLYIVYFKNGTVLLIESDYFCRNSFHIEISAFSIEILNCHLFHIKMFPFSIEILNCHYSILTLQNEIVLVPVSKWDFFSDRNKFHLGENLKWDIFRFKINHSQFAFFFLCGGTATI